MIPYIRPFQDLDFSTLLEIDGKCFEPGIAYDEEELRHFLHEIRNFALVLVLESRVAGFGIVGWSQRKTRVGHLITLDLLPEFRGLGHGKSLLRALEQCLEKIGATRVTLEVDVRNTAAIGFYRKMGYQRDRRLEDYYGRGKDALRMFRSLTG